jgi:hypothetical protein
MAQAAASANPLNYPFFLNSLFLAFSRPVVYKVVVAANFVDANGEPLPIPSNEVRSFLIIFSGKIVIQCEKLINDCRM